MEFVHNLGMYDALSELSHLREQWKTMDIMLPEPILRLSGQAQVSVPIAVSFGIYAIKMAVPNKICTMKTRDMNDSNAVKMHVAKLGTWQILEKEKADDSKIF